MTITVGIDPGLTGAIGIFGKWAVSIRTRYASNE